MNKPSGYPSWAARLLLPVFLLMTAAGCTAFPTAGVKGTPSANGPYTAFRQQAARAAGTNTFRNYVDLGNAWIKGGSPYAPDGSFAHVSISLPLYDDDLIRCGAEAGKNLCFGGVNLYGRGSEQYREVYVSINRKANFTLSGFGGDTEQKVNLDITAEMPPYLAGLRLNWNEWGRGFSILAGARVVPAATDQLEFEFSIDTGGEYFYDLDQTRPVLKAGIGMRYYFQSQRPARVKTNNE